MTANTLKWSIDRDLPLRRRPCRWVRCWLLAIGAWLLCSLPARAADLMAYTEDWPPYNFVRGGRVVGIAVDLLRELCEDARLSCEIQLAPWARAYRSAASTPDTLLFTTARTVEREAAFVWLGPFLPRQTWVFAPLDGRLQQLQVLSDLNRYRTGVVREDAATADLQRAGVSMAALDMAVSEESNLRKLLHGRIDAITGTEVGVAWLLHNAHAGRVRLRRILPLSGEGGYYFAINPQTRADVIDRLRQSFAACTKRRCVDVLVKKYVGGVEAQD